MRAMIGMGYGALAGLAAGLASVVALASGIAVLGAVEEGAEAALGLFLLWSIFGGIVASIVGSVLGAVAGLVLGLLQTEAKAPLVASFVSGAPVLLIGASIVADPNAEKPVLLAVITIVLAAVFAAIAYWVGVGFAKMTALALLSHEPAAGQFPSSTSGPEIGVGHSHLS